MLYDEFVNKVISEDSRNVFGKVTDNANLPDDSFPELYKYYDPIDVEFEFNSGIIHLAPFSEIAELQNEYSYVNADCVFATCNGDPIFIKDGKVFTCLHGTAKVIYEELASSFDEFINEIIR